MYSKNQIVSTTDTILNTCFVDLNPTERLLVLSNLILTEAQQFLPKELQSDAVNIISNGKRIGYELMKHQDNLGLDLALKAHLIIAMVNDHLDPTEND